MVPVVPVMPVADVSVLDVPVIAVPDVSVAEVLLIAVPDVSVAEVLLIAVPDVSLVVIVDDVSLAAVSVMLVFSSFLQANANSASARTRRMASCFFIEIPFKAVGYYVKDMDWN